MLDMKAIIWLENYLQVRCLKLVRDTNVTELQKFVDVDTK